MAVDVQTISRATPAARVLSVPAWLVLTGLVALSAVVRTAAALAHATPRYFPDEYIYSSLARSIADGRLAVRGAPAHFPALLEPLAAAPLWAVADLETAYRLTQTMHAVAVSLAAVPVFLLARRLGLAAWQCLACAALTLLLPSLVFSAYLTADAVALPLALGAVTCGVAALQRPTRRAQVGFVALAGLATFARVQYVVLPAAFLVAALVVEHGRVRATARRFRVTLLLLATPIVVALALGPGRLLGYYDTIFQLDLSPGGIARWLATDSVLLAFAAGWVLVPTAAVGLVAGIVRPRSVQERGFATLVAAFGALLLVEAALYATNGSERFQERYLIALLPLVGPLFFLGLRRLESRAAAAAAAALGVGLVLVAMLLPLAPFTAGLGKQDSPFLQAVFQLEEATDPGTASLVVSLAALGLGLVAVAAAWRPRALGSVALALGATWLAVAAVGAVQYDVKRSALARQTFLADDKSWVDRAGLGPTAVLLTPGTLRPAVSEQLFWNDSLDELLLMEGAEQVDAFGATRVTVGRDGTLLGDGRPLSKSVLVQEYASLAELEGAELVRRTTSTALWRRTGVPRIAMLTDGRYFDGWLAARSSVQVWPRPDGARTGTLRFTATNPLSQELAVELAAPGTRRIVRVPAHGSVPVAVRVAAADRWTLRITAVRPVLFAGRVVSLPIDVPRLEEPSRSTAALPIETS